MRISEISETGKMPRRAGYRVTERGNFSGISSVVL